MRTNGGRLAESQRIAGGMNHSIHQRELGISHLDFLRVFPAVVSGSEVHRSADGAFVVAEHGRRLTVSLHQQRERRIGMLRIPTTRMTFEFAGYDPSEVDAFFERFNRHFHRGGG